MLGQWTLVDVDPRTVTLYVLTTMTGVVSLARLVQAQPLAPISTEGWTTIVLLALIPTAAARLPVFAGLRRLGGVQASLLSIAEVLVALTCAFAWLGEQFTWMQWFGAGLFGASVLLISRDTSLQMADEEVWWQNLFLEPSSEQVHDQRRRLGS